MRFKRPVFKSPVLDMIPIVTVILQVVFIILLTSVFMRISMTSIDLTGDKKAAVQRGHNASVTLYRNGRMTLNNESINPNDLGIKIRGRLLGDRELFVTVCGDSGVEYGKIMEAVDAIRFAGVKKICIATLPKEQ